LLKTVYRSPTTAHIFSFSADEPTLFPNIPSIEVNTIRTQVDLQGFAIETLSPTTTLLTLLEQSDPKGWTNKTSIPQQMITTLAGIGEFAIKCGGPPIATRLSGAKATEIRYDHERYLFRIEYEVSTGRRTSISGEVSASNSQSDDGSSSSSTPIVECELRCDMDTWAASLDIVVDPPPQSISCLRQHRLSSGGGGLWLTLTHDAILASEERLMAIVRRGPGRERGVVMLNGSRVSVDVEELPEAEIKSLSKQRRVKPPRIPLDQPPVLGAIRRRRRDWNGEIEESSTDPPSPTKAEGISESKSSTWSGAVPKFCSPLGRYFMQAMEQAATSTQQAVAAISPPSSGGNPAWSSSEFPLQYALNASQCLEAFHSRSHSVSGGWALISEKGFPLCRKLSPEISMSLLVYKGESVIEGISAEEIAAVVKSYDVWTRWDERFVGAHVLESFAGAGGAHTGFIVSRANFPFRDRGFHLASILVRGHREGKEGSSDEPGPVRPYITGTSGSPRPPTMIERHLNNSPAMFSRQLTLPSMYPNNSYGNHYGATGFTQPSFSPGDVVSPTSANPYFSPYAQDILVSPVSSNVPDYHDQVPPPPPLNAFTRQSPNLMVQTAVAPQIPATGATPNDITLASHAGLPLQDENAPVEFPFAGSVTEHSSADASHELDMILSLLYLVPIFPALHVSHLLLRSCQRYASLTALSPLLRHSDSLSR
jgi:hypothetical protein